MCGYQHNRSTTKKVEVLLYSNMDNRSRVMLFSSHLQRADELFWICFHNFIYSWRVRRIHDDVPVHHFMVPNNKFPCNSTTPVVSNKYTFLSTCNYVKRYTCDLQLPPRRTGDLHYSGLLHSTEWLFHTDVSEKPIVPVFKGQEIQEEGVLEIWRWNR